MRPDRSLEAPGPRMQFPSLRSHALAASAVLACLALASAAGAQDRAQAAPAQEAPESAKPEEMTQAPPGVEVIHVKTRESGGIETDVPASLTTFDAATIQALGVQDVSGLSRV